MKHYRRNAWTLWMWGQVRRWGVGAPWERTPTLCSQCGQQHGASVQSRLEHQCSHDWLRVPPGAISGTCGARAGLIGPNTPTNGSKRPTAKNSCSVPGCSYHCLSSPPYPPQNGIRSDRGGPFSLPHDSVCPNAKTEIRRPYTSPATVSPMADQVRRSGTSTARNAAKPTKPRRGAHAERHETQT